MANRLKTATSPYLLQHADNPVDWWPWSEDAFAAARERDVPVLLSVGYAACHWCHVMAHESFEDPATAAVVNDNVVAIKVDREERPDIDAVYMTATQAMTGQGGWPMTVFMTPDGDPFYCGTYFPRPQFNALVQAIARAWRDDRGDVTDRAAKISRALAENASALADFAVPPGGLSWEPVVSDAVTALEHNFDQADGGFGGAPKFPPSMVLEFLLRHASRAGTGGSGDVAARMVSETSEAMARGGMYDQLGGGFARYSVDGTWTIPHFEKMLYDNALLARAYAHWWRQTGTELGRRVAEETCEFLLRELGTPQRGFAASLDADSEGGEGAFYVWTPAALREALGDADGTWAARVFGVTDTGTFEHGTSVLQRRQDPDDTERLDRIRGTLLSVREGRPRPARDDKVVAAWNGMAIAALAEAGLLFDRPDFTEAATAAAELLDSVHVIQGGAIPPKPPQLTGGPVPPYPPGEGTSPSQGPAGEGTSPSAAGGCRLIRTSRDGVAGNSAGLLEDYACVATGFLVLSGVTGEPRWVAAAGRLLETVLTEFGDGNGGFYDTAADGERLIYRPADPADNATPSGTFAAADALLSYAALTGSARHREAATEALKALPAIASRFPRAAGMGLAVAEALVSGPAEIAVIGPAGDPRTQDLHRTSLHLAPPGAVLAVGAGPDDSAADGSTADGGAAETIPLLAGRGLVRGAPAVYVCRGFTCLKPVTTPAELRETLRG